MQNTSEGFNYIDNGGRRRFPDRRKFAYTYHWPERRKELQDDMENGQETSGEYPFIEKRSIEDRRSGVDRRVKLRYSAQHETT